MSNCNLTTNHRVGTYYALGTIALAAAAALGWPWSAVLLWPATSCAIVAIGYFGAGPSIYKKQHGRLTLATRLIMAPVLLGQDLSLRHYRRQGQPWDEAAPGLLMGRILDESEAEALLANGVTAVLDLTAEFSEVELLRNTSYYNLPILDLTAPIPAQLQSAVDFIRKSSATGTVFVHCKIGYSRTAAAVGAYLMVAGLVDGADEAMAYMRDVRSPLVIRPEVVEALRAFEAQKSRTTVTLK